MPENQDRRFARDARNFSDHGFIGDEITQDHDGLTRKRAKNIEQAGEIGVAGSFHVRDFAFWRSTGFLENPIHCFR